jgi:hypothetical protein
MNRTTNRIRNNTNKNRTNRMVVVDDAEKRDPRRGRAEGEVIRVRNNKEDARERDLRREEDPEKHKYLISKII